VAVTIPTLNMAINPTFFYTVVRFLQQHQPHLEGVGLIMLFTLSLKSTASFPIIAIVIILMQVPKYVQDSKVASMNLILATYFCTKLGASVYHGWVT
jgi:hypothetical protein